MTLRSLTVLFILALAGACATTGGKSDSAPPDTKPEEQQQELVEQTTAGIGERCGTIANIQCAEDAFCDYESEQVTLDDGSGTCLARPVECEEAEAESPVCGRDGTTYPSECQANLAGVDVVSEGAETICKPAE